MKLLKNMLARIYALYALLLFVISMFIVLIPVAFIAGLPEPHRTQKLLPVFRCWMAIYMPLILCPVRKKGLQYFQPGQPYVVICNHNSLMDVPVATTGVPGANKTIAKHTMAKIPFFGLLYRTGSVLVDRRNEKSRRESYEKMKQVLAMGIHMIIYPEGTRNKTDQPLKFFYDGAFNLAIETQCPLMIGVLFHTRKILPPGKFLYAWPHPIEIHFLPPLITTGYTKKDLPVLKEKAFQLMKDYYLQHT